MAVILVRGTDGYRGYFPDVNYSEKDKVYYGKVHGIRDLVTFKAHDEFHLGMEFVIAVDNYLEMCEQLDALPQVPDNSDLFL